MLLPLTRACEDKKGETRNEEVKEERNEEVKKEEERKEEVKIVAVDLQAMAPLPGVTQIQGDITKVRRARSPAVWYLPSVPDAVPPAVPVPPPVPDPVSSSP